MGTKPLTFAVVPFVLKTNSDAVVAAGPDFFDQFVIKLLRPFAFEERQDFLSAMNKFTAVSPHAVFGIGE